MTNETVGKDITKYVYGMVPLEGNETPSFKHSQYTVSLLEDSMIGIHSKILCSLGDVKSWKVK